MWFPDEARFVRVFGGLVAPRCEFDGGGLPSVAALQESWRQPKVALAKGASATLGYRASRNGARRDLVDAMAVVASMAARPFFCF